MLEDNFAQLEEDNVELSYAISDLRSELEMNLCVEVQRLRSVKNY